MSPVIKAIHDTETPLMRESSSRLDAHSITISRNTTDATTYSGAAAESKDITLPAPCAPLPVPLFHLFGFYSSSTPERQYAALSETSRPVDPWLLRERLAALLLQQQEGKEATWLSCDPRLCDDVSPPPEFWDTDPAASPSAFSHQPTTTETHSPPGPPTPAAIEQRAIKGQKRAHDRLGSDYETGNRHGCRHIATEAEHGKADRRRAKKRQKVQG